MKRWMALGAVACVTLAMGFGPAAANGLRKVTFGFPSQVTPYGASWTYGKQLGFFAEEGIDLELVSTQGTAVLLPQIVAKNITFGMVSPDLPLMALDKGSPYPVKLVYNIYSRSLFEFVVPADSPVKTLADLKGRKVGVGALTWGNLPLSRAILADAGVTWMKDVEVLPVGIGPAAWRKLATGEIDALNLFMHQHKMLEISGTPLRRLPMPEKYEILFGNSLVAHDDTIRDEPGLVESLGRAVAKSFYACELNTEACARSFWEFDPASRPAPGKEAEWLATFVQLNKADIEYAKANMKDDRWGAFAPEAWQSFVAAMEQGGQISHRDLDLDRLYTNRFVEGFNRFDRKAVQEKVR